MQDPRETDVVFHAIPWVTGRDAQVASLLPHGLGEPQRVRVCQGVLDDEPILKAMVCEARPCATRGLTILGYNHMVVSVMTVATQAASVAPDPDRIFAALADGTRRDIVWRAMTGEEGVVELAAHYPMSFAAVQKHVAVLERAGLVTKERIGRRKVVRSNVEAIRAAQRMLDRYEQLWRERIARMELLLAEPQKETETWE